MTVSQIANIAPEIKRTQESQAKPDVLTQPAPQSATLPQDEVAPSAYTALQGAGLSKEQATVATEDQNRQASLSVLSEEDLELLGNIPPSERISAQPDSALRAQTANLPADLMQLVAE